MLVFGPSDPSFMGIDSKALIPKDIRQEYVEDYGSPDCQIGDGEFLSCYFHGGAEKLLGTDLVDFIAGELKITSRQDCIIIDEGLIEHLGEVVMFRKEDNRVDRKASFILLRDEVDAYLEAWGKTTSKYIPLDEEVV